MANNSILNYNSKNNNNTSNNNNHVLNVNLDRKWQKKKWVIYKPNR